MPLEFSFDSNLDNFAATVDVTSPAYVQFDSTIGNASPGSAKLHAETLDIPPVEYHPAYMRNDSDTHVIAAGEDLYFNGRFTSTVLYESNFVTQIFYVRLQFSDASPIDVFYYGYNLIPTGYDSGWLQFAIDLASREGKTCNFLQFGLLAHSVYQSVVGQLTAWIDSTDFATSPPAFDPNPTFGAELWQGVASLAKKADLPFSQVAAPDLAIRFDGQVAVANAAGGAPLVVTYSPADNYAAATNRSHDHPAVAIRRIKYVES